MNKKRGDPKWGFSSKEYDFDIFILNFRGREKIGKPGDEIDDIKTKQKICKEK